MAESRLIRLPEVLARVGVGRSKLYQLLKIGKFPAPRKIGKVSAWRSDDVDAWIDQQEVAA